MSVRISQIHDPVRDCVLVRVEGSLNYRNSLLLEQVCQGIQVHSGQPVVINLEDLLCLDACAATTLTHLYHQPNIRLEGCGPFTLQMLDAVTKDQICA